MAQQGTVNNRTFVLFNFRSIIVATTIHSIIYSTSSTAQTYRNVSLAAQNFTATARYCLRLEDGKSSDTFSFQNISENSTWWLIPLSKWVLTPVISGLTLLIPLITGVITHLLSGMSHQVINHGNLILPTIRQGRSSCCELWGEAAGI